MGKTSVFLLCSAVAGFLFSFMPICSGFEFALGKTQTDAKNNLKDVNWKNGVSITGLLSGKTKRVALRGGTATLARDSKYLYLGITTKLPADSKIKLKDNDTVFFSVTAPNGKKVELVLNHNGKGAVPNGILQNFKMEKKNYVHQIAIPWTSFGIKAPAPDSVWKIQMGRVYQSPTERTQLNLKTPVLVRMDDHAPALTFKAEKSGWQTGYYPKMDWAFHNYTAKELTVEGKADITWIGNPIQFQKKEKLAPGKEIVFSQLLSGGADSDLRTCNMEFKSNGKPLFVHTLELGGSGLNWQATVSSRTTFRMAIYPTLDTAKANVFNRNPGLLKNFDKAEFQIIDEKGNVYSSTKVDKENNQFYVEWKMPRLKDGKYFMTGKLIGNDGKNQDLEKQSFDYKRFDWENNKVGLDRVVIPPFKPLTLTKDTQNVKATLTGYTFGKNLLESITAQGEELLKKPVTFHINDYPLVIGKLKYTEVAPDRIRAEADATIGKLKAKISYDIDYDGMIWITMDFDPGKWAFIKNMHLEIPMKSEYARYLHATCARTRQHPNVALADKEGVVFNSRTNAPNNFLSYVWYGGAEKGICWFTETEKEWNYDPNKATTEIIRKKDGSTVLRVSMINQKTFKKGKFSISMGFLATPVKPVMPNANRYASIQVMTGWTPPKALRVTPAVYAAKGMKPAPETPFYKAKRFDTTSWEPYDYSILRMIKTRGLTKKQSDALIDQYIEKYMSSFSPAVKKRYKGLVDHAYSCYTKNHDKLLYYFNPRSALLTWDAYRILQDEWYAGDYRNNYEGMYSAEPVKSYQDYVMPILQQYARNGLDGIYYDCTYESASLDKVMFPDADNKSGRRLFRNMRNLIKRTATMLYMEGRKIEDRSMVEVHMTNGAIIPMMSFASHSLGWEIFYGSKDYQDRFSHAYLMSESIGTQAGVVSKLLIDCHNDPERLLRTALAVTLPYGLTGHLLTGGNPTASYKQTLSMLDYFGYRDPGVKIFTCFDTKNPVRSADDRIKVLTVKFNGQYLLFAGNTGHGGKLDLDISKLGFSTPAAVDAFTGNVIGTTNRITGEMPYHGYRMILVGKDKQDAEAALKRTNPTLKK